MNFLSNKEIHCLAFDIGAESGRAIIGRFNGERVSLEEVHRFPNGPVRVGDHLYTDILNIWTWIQEGIQKAYSRSGDNIHGIGVDTWGVDYALLDKNDRLLANPYHYRDHRTDGLMEQMFSIVPSERIYQQTGNQFMQFNSLIQLFAMKKQEPQLLGNAQTLLMLPDLLHFWLCGEKVSEFCNSTTTQCFDQQAGKWAVRLLEKFDLPAGIFQKITKPGTAIGSLHTWLTPGNSKRIPIILPASHDTASAVTAVPVDQRDFLYISSGTWSLVGTELDQPVISEESLRKNLTNEGNPCGKTKFLKIVPGMWILQQCKYEWANRGITYSYDDLTQLAASATNRSPFIDVTSPEFLDPGLMVHRVQDYCRRSGQTVPTSDGEVVYCVLKSLACLYRSLLSDFEAVLGKDLPVVHIIGGGSRNSFLNQMTADITRKPVVAGPVEATAAGNILVQVMGIGYLSTMDDIRQVVHRSFKPLRFEPSSSAVWEDEYQKYLKVLDGQAAKLS
jgi:rhamnulokinase